MYTPMPTEENETAILCHSWSSSRVSIKSCTGKEMVSRGQSVPNVMFMMPHVKSRVIARPFVGFEMFNMVTAYGLLSALNFIKIE